MVERLLAHEQLREARRRERIQQTAQLRAVGDVSRRPPIQPGRILTQRRPLRERVGRRSA